METNQYFIIWNHGIPYIKTILDIIRNHSTLKITKILKKTINIPHFIDHIYSLDNALKDHISEKTKYLKNMTPICFIIFVKDLDTQYVIKPRSNHRYSLHETLIKWHIRLLFNPRSKDVNININKQLLQDVSIQRNWPDEITHEHVIHSSDIEEETYLISEYFNLPNDVFDMTGNIYHDIYKEIKTLNINDIVVNTTYKDHMNVINTPHYKYLMGEKEQYDNYIMETLGIIITHDNLSGAYDKLINNFNYGIEIQGEPSYIICSYDKSIGKYVVMDGVHRLCICINNGLTELLTYII